MSRKVTDAIKAAISGGRAPGVEAPKSEQVPQSALKDTGNIPSPQSSFPNEVRVLEHQVEQKYNPTYSWN